MQKHICNGVIRVLLYRVLLPLFEQAHCIRCNHHLFIGGEGGVAGVVEIVRLGRIAGGFDDGKEEMQNITYKAAPNVLMLVQTNGYTNYYSREGEKSYMYSMSNGKWEKSDYSGEAPVGSAILKMNLIIKLAQYKVC